MPGVIRTSFPTSLFPKNAPMLLLYAHVSVDTWLLFVQIVMYYVIMQTRPLVVYRTIMRLSIGDD